MLQWFLGSICARILTILLVSLLVWERHTVGGRHLVSHILWNWFEWLGTWRILSFQSIPRCIGDFATCILVFLQTHFLQYLPSFIIFPHNSMKFLAFATIEDSIIADTFYSCCIIPRVHHIFMADDLAHIHQRNSHYMSFQLFLDTEFFVFWSSSCVVSVLWSRCRFWAEETFDLLWLG